MIIVAGAPFTGTSLVAGTLKLLGVYMGEADNERHECDTFMHMQSGYIQACIREGGFKSPIAHLWIEKAHHYFKAPKYILCRRGECEIQDFWLKFLKDKNHIQVPFDTPQKERIQLLVDFLQLTPTQEQLDAALEFYNKERGYHAIH